MSQNRPVEVPAYMHAKELKIALIEEMRVRIEAHVSAKEAKEAKDLLGEQQKLQQEVRKSIFTDIEIKEGQEAVERIRSYGGSNDHESKTAEINANLATTWQQLTCALVAKVGHNQTTM